jgi:hypothetical protein
VNPLQIGAVVGLLVAGAAWCIAQSVQRAPRSLAAARHRMYGTGGAVSPSLAPARAPGSKWADSLAAGWLGRWVALRFGVGLQVLGLGPADVVSRVLASVGVALFATLSALAALMSLGLVAVSPLWPMLAVAVAAAAGWVALGDIATRIERRRRELRQAANDFVQLVAVGLTTDQSVEEAIRFALSVGASDAFDALRTELDTAPQRGVAVWEALDEFGLRFGVRELSEFAASIERQGLQGVSISDTVTSLATSMRAKALDELEREADRANANLSGPTIGFVVTTIVFLAYPLAQRISAAFGG